MQVTSPYDMIAIGGSAGSLPVLAELLEQLPASIDCTMMIIVHRLKNVPSDLDRLLSLKAPIIEPEDKQPVLSRRIYLAPQNYHLLIEDEGTFALDYAEPLHYSRPSIDVSFASVAEVYGPRALAILLSGASKDGAAGMQRIIAAGGTGFVQDPASALFDTMPLAALELCPEAQAMSLTDMVHFLTELKMSAEHDQ
ncbi:chemotaxis protein CheB [Chitinophaga sp. 22536]|uniref:chemotaxis protein CheB n=1 Tax=unclassified Chitinophaga TaxID=2619133 RepID=UPI003F87103C